MLHPTQVTTLERYILDQEREHPEATGELTNLLYDIALAAKLIAAQIRRAGLVNILGTAGATNVQGEEQQKLDVWAMVGIGLIIAGVMVINLLSKSTAH